MVAIKCLTVIDAIFNRKIKNEKFHKCIKITTPYRVLYKTADIRENGTSRSVCSSETIFLSTTRNACSGLSSLPVTRT